jgi:LPXTG-site transpeptidase (sortase) family protein
VIPSVGTVTPIVTIPQRDKAFGQLVSGKEVSVAKYLDNGALQYPRTAWPGQYGNMVVAGHSSYFDASPGRYRTVFGTLPSLSVWDTEVWVYEKNKSGTYDLYRYRITESYNTNPRDVSVMLPRFGKKEITLYTCTPIGGLKGRWIIRAELI